MNRKTDVIVIGSGLAGLMAAYMAAKKNLKVRVISEGMGALAIGGGYVDVLGRIRKDGKAESVAYPFDGIAHLPPEHPYKIAGEENLRASLEELRACLSAQGLDMAPAKDGDGKFPNSLAPTVMGTLKPTWLLPADFDPALLQSAAKILVISVRGFRDCKPSFIISQLRRYRAWKDRQFDPLVIPGPFSENGRSLNALDLARAAERPDGIAWLEKNLAGKGAAHDLALMPPLCGSRADRELARRAREILGCPFLEMLSVPPAVIGLRIRDAFLRELAKLDVEFFENSRAFRARVENGVCKGLSAQATGRVIEHEAAQYVVATGGILSGGVLLQEGKAKEAVFGLEIPAPENVDEWTEKELLGDHPVTRLGIRVDGQMRPLGAGGEARLANVRFAGRTLGGYDWTEEKCGLGVACVSGWLAGKHAAEDVLAAGAEK